MVERPSLFNVKTSLLRTDLWQARVDLTRAHLAEVPVLRGGLAGKIIPLPIRAELIGADEILARGLKALGSTSAVRVEDEGLDFKAWPARLTDFGDAVAMMKETLARRGSAKTAYTGPSGARAAFEVERAVADSRQITARLAVNEGKLEIIFSIYRHVVSMLDYVQIAVTLPGLAVCRHTEEPRFYLAADR